MIDLLSILITSLNWDLKGDTYHYSDHWLDIIDMMTDTNVI